MDILSLIFLISIFCGQILKFPLNFGGILPLDIVVFLFTLIGLINLKFKLKKPKTIIKVTFLFLLICITSLILTPLQIEKGEYLIAFSYITRLFFYFLFGWIVYSNGLKSTRQNSIKILTISGILLAIIGIFQFIVFPDLGSLTDEGWDPHYFRLVSTFLDPNFAGMYLVLTLLLIHRFGKVIFSFNQRRIFFLLVFLALMFTFSRSSYLAFFVGFLIYSLLLKSKKVFLGTLILTISLGLAFYFYGNLVAEPRNIDRIQSAQYRTSSWKQGLEIYSRNPILGVGFNNYRFALIEYSLIPTENIKNHGVSTNDSSLLYVAATTGVIGLATFITLITGLLIYGLKLKKTNNPNGIIILSSLSGLFIHSFFANSLFYPPILIWMILLISSSSNFKNE